MDSERLNSGLLARFRKESTTSQVTIARGHKDSTVSIPSIFQRHRKASTTSHRLFRNRNKVIHDDQMSMSGSIKSSKGLPRRRRETLRKHAATEKSIQRLTEHSRSDSKRRIEGEKLMKFLLKDVKACATESLDMTLNHDAIELWKIDEAGTLLKYAVSRNFTDVVAILLRYNSPIESHGEDGLSPLHLAIKLGYIPIFAMLLAHNHNINSPTLYEHRTPLHVAVRCNSTEALELLLSHGADPNKGDIYGSSPLHLAARLGREHLLRILIENGGEVQAIDNEGWTPLHAASEAGHVLTVRTLLQNHAVVDAQSKYGKTCLHWACGNGHLPVVEALLDYNANTSIRDANGKVASDYTTAPVLRNLIASYTKEPETAHKMGDIKSDYFDVRLPKKSLIDLLDLSLYSDPYAHRLDVEMIGRWAMKDALSKAKREKSKSMPYIMYDSSELESIQESIDELARSRLMSLDPNFLSPYTQDGGPIGRAFAARNDQAIRNDNNSRYSHSVLAMNTLYGTTERIDSNPICESLPLLSLGTILEERPPVDVQFTIAEEPILPRVPSILITAGSETESMTETGSDVKKSEDGEQTTSGIDSKTESEICDSFEVINSIRPSLNEQSQIQIHKVSDSVKCKVSPVTLIETLENLHDRVDESVEENVDILNDVFRDVIMLRRINSKADTKTRQTALSNIEDNLKTVVMKLNTLRDKFNSVSSKA